MSITTKRNNPVELITELGICVKINVKTRNCALLKPLVASVFHRDPVRHERAGTLGDSFVPLACLLARDLDSGN